MQIVYFCRHCRSYMGELDGDRVDDRRLGFHSLTDEERADIITYNRQINSIYVRTICEFCQEALERNPELTLVDNPLQ